MLTLVAKLEGLAAALESSKREIEVEKSFLGDTVSKMELSAQV